MREKKETCGPNILRAETEGDSRVASGHTSVSVYTTLGVGLGWDVGACEPTL